MTSTSIGRARSGSASTLANARNMIERTLGGRSRGGSISNEHSTPKTRTRSGSNPLSRLMNRTATPTQSEHEVDPSVANDTPVAPGICTPTFGNMNWSLPPLDTRTAPASHDDMWDALNSSEELTEMLDSESVPRDFGDAENHLTRRSLGLGFDPTGLVA
ncbi:hypothetical protein CBOM_00949 [Ceraceosorus bombacis]|uniref:Uncharacterized protein n=1 Tax=Ceraceosorus bombacis TaxID=401625 RepID=A0A0N7L975_9BASI|nr:hypothetical protein CBOM_00949 [Ceraceosorus bombacis]